jgi:site-specific recombinase XerD
MLKEKENSIDAKSELKIGSDSIKCDGLSKRMLETLEDYLLSLHGITEDSKEVYIGQVKTFGLYLISRKIEKFEDIRTKDIDLFLSRYEKDSTKNNYIIRLKHFYGRFLKLPHLVEHQFLAISYTIKLRGDMNNNRLW